MVSDNFGKNLGLGNASTTQFIAQGDHKFGRPSQVEVAVDVKQVGSHGLSNLLGANCRIRMGYEFKLKLVQRL
jgi:hypothetical protein